MMAAASVGLLLVSILLFSPSGTVNATRTVIPLEIQSLEPDSNTVVKLPAVSTETSLHPNTAAAPTTEWKRFPVQPGDTLSVLFKRAGFNDKVMYSVLGSAVNKHDLTRIFPGEALLFALDGKGVLSAVKLERSKLEAFVFTRNDDGVFEKSIETRTPDIHVAYAAGLIESSLFLAGEKAGLTQTQIMELAGIFGWDIDFVMDIREGDRFELIYEELFLDGDKYQNGKILAASFSNDGRTLSAVLYEQQDGLSNYFTPDGDSMRKAFLRTPVDFARISSHFNLQRRHPVLHKIRAHKGTDYAASTGTPIRASGDGKIIHAGRKGGYGNTVIVQHGHSITTLYAHMSRYAKGIRAGNRVKQGQVIGYVGSTGLASGPHLHYEFQVNGVHKNPVRVQLPHAEPVASAELDRFRRQTGIYLSQLSTFRDSHQLAQLD
jgi:murein DD-endopeptidase MepM/ murein hydrolase activator NlpD